MRWTTWVLVAMALISVTVGCKTTVKQAQYKQALELTAGEKSKPIQFTKIVVKLQRGQKIGSVREGLLAVPKGDLTWQGGRMQLDGDEFSEVFREELEKANYEVVGDPDALFEDPSSWKAELLVAGLVKDMKANICYPWAGNGNFSKAKGEAWMEVDWQVYSRLDREVVYTCKTEGSSIVKKASTTGESDLFLNAFAMATNNLLADDGFKRVVTGEAKPEAVPLPSALNIKRTALSSTAVSDHVEAVRNAVVTIFAGDGHGSGFVISPDGYILTNYHVVGEAKHVNVKTAVGKEVIGEVIRSNKRRDAAIVKAADIGAQPLPVRDSAVQVTEEVFAIGSPLDESLNTTVSKGVVSATRDEGGLNYIQSDVNVLPGNSGGPLVDRNGNVVGITVKGRVIENVPAGVNFFIPIMDALKHLGIELAE